MKSLFSVSLTFLLGAISVCFADEGDQSKPEVAKAALSAEQTKILEGGKTADWEVQGVSWTVPSSGWGKLDVKKEMFNYGSPGAGFLIGTVSTMPAGFPVEISQNAMYKQALEKVENGDYESVRWLEIDGVKGIEWVETMPEDGGDPRRHQWVAYRPMDGKNQLLSIMVSTKGSGFDAKKETFAAILYSMKFAK